MTTVTIKTLKQITVNTKNGPKQKFNMLVNDGKSEFWCDLWCGPNTQGLKAGDQLTGDIEPREYNGKTFYTLKIPNAVKVQKSAALDTLAQIIAKIDELSRKIDNLSNHIIQHETQNDCPLPSFDDVPPPSDEDIPF